MSGDWSFPETEIETEAQAPGVRPGSRRGSASGRGAAGASVSDSAKDLISGALTVDRKARLTADGVLNHPWLQLDRAVSTAALAGSVSAAVRSRAEQRKSLAARHVKTWSSLPRSRTC